MSDPGLPDFASSISAMNESMDTMRELAYRKNNPAEFMHGRLMEMIRRFERKLTDEQEIGARIGSGPEQEFHVNKVSYSNPDLIVFSGRNAEGLPVQVIQHHSQLNVALVALKKLSVEPLRIGF